MLGLAVAAMTSCSNDELMEVNTDNVITFESHVNKGTRAVTGTDALTTFYVFGYHDANGNENTVFNNDDVKGSIGGSWSYDDADLDPVPWTANTYWFGAYANKNASDKLANVAFTNKELKFTGYTANDAEDLIAAVSSKTPSVGGSNSAVDLTFKHMLSKVYFVLTNNSADKYDMKVYDIKFNVNSSGDCVFNGTKATWSNFGASKELKFTENSGTKIAFGNARTTEEHFVIPNQALGSINASFKVEFFDTDGNKVDETTYNNVSIKLDTEGNNTWQPGYIYKYTASITSETDYIVFNVSSIDGWSTSEPGAGLN